MGLFGLAKKILSNGNGNPNPTRKTSDHFLRTMICGECGGQLIRSQKRSQLICTSCNCRERLY